MCSLFSICLEQAVEAVADRLVAHGVRGLVVDPVLVATSGDSLAGSEVAEAIKRCLFPLATVITPNVPEASAMLGKLDCMPSSFTPKTHLLLCSPATLSGCCSRASGSEFRVQGERCATSVTPEFQGMLLGRSLQQCTGQSDTSMECHTIQKNMVSLCHITQSLYGTKDAP